MPCKLAPSLEMSTGHFFYARSGSSPGGATTAGLYSRLSFLGNRARHALQTGTFAKNVHRTFSSRSVRFEPWRSSSLWTHQL